MKSNEVIVFAGQTLSILTDGIYPPLFHRVNITQQRHSMPYFLRLHPTQRIGKDNSKDIEISRNLSVKTWSHQDIYSICLQNIV